MRCRKWWHKIISRTFVWNGTIKVGKAESDGKAVLLKQSGLKSGVTFELKRERWGGSCETSVRIFQVEENRVQNLRT